MWPFSPEQKGNITVKLVELKIKSKIKDLFKMVLESKRLTPEYEIEIQIREPILEKEYIVKTRSVLKIVKTYPPFEIERIEKIEEVKESPHQTQSATRKGEVLNKENKTTNEKKEEKKKESSVPIQIEEKKGKESNESKINSSDFSQLDIKDPENIDNINTIKTVEYVLMKVEKKMSQVEGRAPMELRQSKMKLSVKKKMIEEKVNDGSIQLKEYLSIVVSQIDKNRKLGKYFEQEGMKENKEKTDALLKILTGEFEEGKKYLNGN